jgi:6-methylsalicylate decarboxylase
MPNKYFVVDVHNHYIPHEVVAKGGKADGNDIGKAAEKRPVAYKSIRDAEETLQIMDESGIDVTVLSIPQWSSLGLEASKVINNDYARIIKKYPKRFIGSINIPLQPEPEVIHELERAAKELGLTSVSLVSSTSKIAIGSKELAPLFEKIDRLKLPVVVHPTIRAPLWGGVEYMESYHISREYEIAKATVETLYGWLAKYPAMQFIMPHFGGGMPNLKGRLIAWHEPEGWDIPAGIKGGGKTPQEVAELGLDKDFEKIFGKLHFDMAGFAGWMPIVNSAVETIRSESLCFGTDYPLDFHNSADIKAYIENIKKLNVPEKDKRNMLGENARKIFKLDKNS